MTHRMTRRDFLKTTAMYSAGACCVAALGPLRSSHVFAESLSGLDRTAVFLNQFGGNDPLNSFMVPYLVDAYFDRRPTIGISANNVLQLSNGIGLNPVLTNLHALYQAGDVAVIQGIGDPQGTRSHFTSQEIFSRGITDSALPTERRGWIGRLGDLYFKDVNFNTLGLGVGERTDFQSDRAKNRPITTSQLTAVGFNDDYGVSTKENEFRRDIRKKLLTTVRENDREESARRSQKQLYDSMNKLKEVEASYSKLVTYPNTTLGRYFIDAAKVVEYGLGTKVCYGGRGGWDTHSSQPGSQTAGLREIDEALLAFSNDLKRMGKWNNVVICIFTEFGRNTFENASGGTDHGWGGAMVLIGGAVKGGVYGATPSDSEIRSKGWLYMDIDFRNVFSNIVTWLGYNPSPVFPEQYTKVNLKLF